MFAGSVAPQTCFDTCSIQRNIQRFDGLTCERLSRAVQFKKHRIIYSVTSTTEDGERRVAAHAPEQGASLRVLVKELTALVAYWISTQRLQTALQGHLSIY